MSKAQRTEVSKAYARSGLELWLVRASQLDRLAPHGSDLPNLASITAQPGNRLPFSAATGLYNNGTTIPFRTSGCASEDDVLCRLRPAFVSQKGIVLGGSSVLLALCSGAALCALHLRVTSTSQVNVLP